MHINVYMAEILAIEFVYYARFDQCGLIISTHFKFMGIREKRMYTRSVGFDLKYIIYPFNMNIGNVSGFVYEIGSQ